MISKLKTKLNQTASVSPDSDFVILNLNDAVGITLNGQANSVCNNSGCSGTTNKKCKEGSNSGCTNNSCSDGWTFLNGGCTNNTCGG